MKVTRKILKQQKDFGKAVKMERLDMGLSQQKLADKIGISKVGLFNIEKGNNSTKLTIATKIATVCSLDLNAFGAR